MKLHKAALFLILLLVVLPDPCHGAMSFDDVVKTLEGLSKQHRLERVRREAQKEGRVVWMSGKDLARMEPIRKLWEASYPGVRLEYRRASGRVVADRVLREYAAGKYDVDVMSPSAVTFSGVKDAGVIRPYFSPEAAAIRRDMKDSGGFWTSSSTNVFSIFCNTKRVRNLPKDWNDFIDPKWKGDFSIDSDRVPWFYRLNRAYGDGGAKRLITGYVKNGALIRRGGTLQAQLVAAGEYSCALGQYLHSAALIKKSGAPIDYVVPEPAFASPDIYLMTKSPPHPHAAILLFDHLISAEGVAADTGNNAVLPARDDVSVVEDIKRLRQKQILTVDIEEESRNYGRTEDLYRQLLQQ